MVFVLADDWLYMDINGQVGSYGRDEVARNLKSQIKTASVSFIDCETKIIDMHLEENVKRQALISAAFSSDFLLQEERINNQQFQIIAAKKEKIESIYAYFKGIRIQHVIPYPVAIRAYMMSKGLMQEYQQIVFVDDLKTQAIVTIFEGLIFTSPRRISMRDMSYMSDEIKRSQNSFLASRSMINNQKTISFIVVSNNQEWLRAFISHGLTCQENIRHVSVEYPVLEGLKTARFGLNFILPEEMARQKRHQILRSRIMYGLLLLITLFLGFYSYEVMFLIKKDAQEKLFQLKQDQKMVIQQLKDVYGHKLGSLMNPFSASLFGRLYLDFINNIPVGYYVKEFVIEPKESSSQFTAVIVPENTAVLRQSFMCKGRFEEAKLATVVVGKLLGQKIDLLVANKKGIE